jgi:hypothetical protein
MTSALILALALGATPAQPCEREWTAFHNLKLRWPALSAMAELKQSVKDKTAALDVLRRCLDNAPSDQSVCAATRLGEGYAEFASALRNVPVPEGAGPELAQEVRAQFGAQAEPLDDKAVDYWKTAVARAGERHEDSECSWRAATLIRKWRETAGGATR